LVRKLFNDAERWGFFVGKNPARLVPPPKVVKKVARYAAVEPYRTIDAIAIYGARRRDTRSQARRPRPGAQPHLGPAQHRQRDNQMWQVPRDPDPL
jgi:hypothetical protein